MTGLFSMPYGQPSEDELVLVVRLASSVFMRGNSLCHSITLTPLKRKSTMSLSDMFGDIQEDIIVNFYTAADGLYTVESSCSYDEFGNVDEVEYYLKPYKEKSNV